MLRGCSMVVRATRLRGDVGAAAQLRDRGTHEGPGRDEPGFLRASRKEGTVALEQTPTVIWRYVHPCPLLGVLRFQVWPRRLHEGREQSPINVNKTLPDRADACQDPAFGLAVNPLFAGRDGRSHRRATL